MTNQQTVALQNPCEHAEQTANQRYRTVVQRGPYYVSVMLTVNVGEEWTEFFRGRALWMVSVALLARERGGPIPRDEWTRKELKMARRAARAAIEGVGDESTDVAEDGNTTVVIRRQCKDHERQQVLERYLSV